MEHGFIYEPAEAASRKNTWKYAIEGATPNTGTRSLRMVFIPSPRWNRAKIVTIMWKDK